MCIQHDGASPHFSADGRSVLDTAYPGRWIGRGGPVNCSACSLDLSYLDFFIWGLMKSTVYASPIDSDEALVAKIAVVAGDIREMPGYLLKFESPSAGGELKTDHKTVLSHLRKVGFKKKFHVWVPHQLAPKNMMDRIYICKALAKPNKIDSFLKRKVTGDENWAHVAILCENNRYQSAVKQLKRWPNQN
ncbi:uncharacterized protein TNCV_1293871 [Trichonephila clavipes]|nr:uncharacterized protein TNCV_1293871 [Trichonephila clavipes]